MTNRANPQQKFRAGVIILLSGTRKTKVFTFIIFTFDYTIY